MSFNSVPKFRMTGALKDIETVDIYPCKSSSRLVFKVSTEVCTKYQL